MTQIQELVEQALATSTGDDCVVIAEDHTETNLRWAANSLTTNGEMHTRSVTVVSFADRADGRASGVLTRSVSNAEELDELVHDADAAARAAAPADDAAPLVENYEHGDDWGGDPATTSVEVFAELAPTLGAAFSHWARADRLLFGFAEHHMTSTYLGTSTGLRRRFDQPDGRVEVTGKSADYLRSSYANQHSNDFTDVDTAVLTDQLQQRLDWAANRVQLDAGRYETVLPASAVADLLIYAYWTASARDAEEGRSVYSGSDHPTRVGERLSPLPLRLFSDPGYAGIECAPFQVVPQSFAGLVSVFDNGLPNDVAHWITDGTLTNLVGTRSWAEQSSLTPRPFVDNLVLDAGGTSRLEDMVAATEHGLLLTTLWYIREVDPQTLLVTGLTRDGVYLIDNGKVAAAVNNFRFNESPIDLLSRTTEAGRTEHAMAREWSDHFRRTAMPALRVPDFNMSTVSQAS